MIIQQITSRSCPKLSRNFAVFGRHFFEGVGDGDGTNFIHICQVLSCEVLFAVVIRTTPVCKNISYIYVENNETNKTKND